MGQHVGAANLRRFGRAAAAAFAVLLAASPLRGEEPEVVNPQPPVDGPIIFPDSQIEVVDWRALDGWAEDDHEAGFASFLLSCRALVNSAKSTQDDRPMRAALTSACRRAFAAIPLDNAGARKFFEENFRPVRIAKLGDKDGFLTGYYEPIVEGSRVPTPQYTVPLYRRPADLIVGNKPLTGPNFPNKGVKVFRRVGKKKLVPYYERSEIDNGALDGRHLEICWLKDPVDAFFIHIQGSARVRLEDGAVLRVNYDGHNGHPYLPVGRIMIERKIATKDEMSMDRIREYMAANPEEGRALRYMNKSYVFFRITELADHQEAEGAQGVALTAGRSIAVDKALHVYGTPFFIDGDLPIEDGRSTNKFQRLMLAQDTGSAIIGPARADIYFGAGEEAARIGGRIKHNARFTMLMPKEIDPVEAGAKFPLPPRQPGSPEPPPIAVAAAAPAAAASARPSAISNSLVRVDTGRGAASKPVVASAPAQAGTVPLPPPSEVEKGVARTLDLVHATALKSAFDSVRLSRKVAATIKPGSAEDARDDGSRRSAMPPAAAPVRPAVAAPRPATSPARPNRDASNAARPTAGTAAAPAATATPPPRGTRLTRRGAGQ